MRPIQKVLDDWKIALDNWHDTLIADRVNLDTNIYLLKLLELKDFTREYEKAKKENSMPISDTLAERQNTHGDFRNNATISRRLKEAMYNTDGWAKLSDVQREALDVVQAKVARILSGDPNEPDHWHDIAGYATLAERDLSASTVHPYNSEDFGVAQAQAPEPLYRPEDFGVFRAEHSSLCECSACKEVRKAILERKEKEDASNS